MSCRHDNILIDIRLHVRPELSLHEEGEPQHFVTNELNFAEDLHVCTVHQPYQSTFLLFQTDAHNYKIIGIIKQLKFRLSLRHVSVHAGTIIRELFRA
jgi:hypothetical protein